MTNYPTEWTGGKERGAIVEFPKNNPTSYLVTLSPPKQKQIYKSFNFKEYGSKDKALFAAKEYRKQESDKLELTLNQIRYIDKDTIEVKLTQDKIMKTDAKFLDKVEKYKLHVRVKKDKKSGTIKNYVYCQKGKEKWPFTNLICNHSLVGYDNGDTLDLRSFNLKELRKGKLIQIVDDDSDDDNDKNISIKTDSKKDKYQEIIDQLSTCPQPVLDYAELKNSREYSFERKLACFQKAKKIVEKRGGKMLSQPYEYQTAHTKLKIQCPDGHIWFVTWSNLNLQKWCPKCNLHIGELISKSAVEFLLDVPFEKVRPSWLKFNTHPLELDAYNEKYKLAVEYNGQQHYQYVSNFHRSEDDFKKQQERDKKKAELCKEHGIDLIIVAFTTNNEDICKHLNRELIDLGYNIPKDRYKEFKLESYQQIISRTEKIQKLIEDKGGELIDGVYISRDSFVTIKCDKGHIEQKKIKNLVQGNWCQTCAHKVSDESKILISNTLINYYQSEEGKKKKKQSFEVRAATMAKEREELRATITEKYCSCQKCERKGQLQPTSAFGKKADAKDGFQPYCKVCINRIKVENREKKKNISKV